MSTAEQTYTDVAAVTYDARIQLALSILGHRENTDGLSRQDCLVLRAALEGRDVLGGGR